MPLRMYVIHSKEVIEMRCLETMKITEILRLYNLNFNYRDIATSVGCSKTTVGEILKRCNDLGVTYDIAITMPDSELNSRIYPETFGRKPAKQEPDWEAIHARLTSNRRINIRFIWEEEYRPANPDGYSYSHFCAKYNKWKDESGKNVVLVKEREPGKELFIDWVGDKLPCVVDTETGEVIEAHFFVTTLGDGSYPFVEAFPNENQLSWNQGHIDALEWYGGVPRIFVPDNCKTAVIHTSMYDPEINHAYRDLARHYGAAIIPARVRKPKDKGTVESGVGWLETWLLGWLDGRIYTSFETLNADIKLRVKELAKKPFQKRTGTRESVFLTLDKPALNPLPRDRFLSYETKLIKRVGNNYHVEYDGFYYSVPYAYYTKSVVIHAYTRCIQIYDLNHDRIAIHERRITGRRYITSITHMPENHKAVVEMNSFDGSYYRKRAEYIGPNTYDFICKLLDNASFEEQAYKSCMGIIRFKDKYGADRLEMACNKALALKSVSYTTIKNILQNRQETQPLITSSDTDTPTPYHENLRVGEWS